MTDTTNDSAAPEQAPALDASAATTPGSTANKAFWLGIGVGSAALVAALMYAKRPKSKKRT